MKLNKIKKNKKTYDRLKRKKQNKTKENRIK